MPPGVNAAHELLAAARAVDREFLARVGDFPVRIEIRYEAIEPLRLQRLELGLDTAYRILEGWGRGSRLSATLEGGELERRLQEILRLYAEETLALSQGVRLPRILFPLRELIEQRLLQAMRHAASSLARSAAVAVQKG